MVDRRPNDIHYGHLGEATYDVENKEWRFNRVPGKQTILRPLGSSKTSVSASVLASPLGQHQTHTSVRHQAQLLSRSLPEIDPSVSLLPALAETSEAITSLTAQYDPLISERFALGKAANAEYEISASKAISVAAMAAGEHGQALRLIQVREDWYGWGSNSNVNISVPEIGGGIDGWWAGNGGAIQQIIFAETAGSTTSWLAVRLPSMTIIFHPLLQSVSVPASYLGTRSHSKRYPSSPLDANPVLIIPAKQTGGTPHADVTFNPWHKRQLAIVDQQGFWSIWSIEDFRHGFGSAYAKAEKHGHVSGSADDGADRAFTGRGDGWGRILWAADGNTLVICDRRHLAVFDTKALESARLPSPDLGLTRSPDWILDMKRSSLDDGHVFVLTSSRIFWLAITGAGEEDDVASGARILLSIRHYREGDDISLNMRMVPLNEEEILLLVHSHFNNLVNTFQFSLPIEQPSIPTITSGPYILHFPEEPFDSVERDHVTSPKEAHSIATLAFVPLGFSVNTRFEAGGLGNTYMDHEVQFFEIFIQLSDLSLACCLYSSGVPESGWQRDQNRFEEVIAPSLQVKNKGGAVGSAMKVDSDDFIVEDDMDEEWENEDKAFKSSRPRRKASNWQYAAGEGRQGDPWTVDSHKIYDLATRTEDIGPRDVGGIELPEKQNLSKYIVTLKTRLESKFNTGFRPIESLLELTSSKPHVGDLSQEPLSFDDSLQNTLDEINSGEDKSALTTKSLVPRSFFESSEESLGDVGREGPLHFSEIYKSLLELWTAPLSDKVPQETRDAKTKIVAQVAAELSLSSIGVSLRPNEVEDSFAEEISSSQPVPIFNLPVRPHARNPASNTLNKGKQRQPIPYPSPEPSSLVVPTSSSLDNATSTLEEDPASVRLRAYASFEPQPRLPSTLSTFISHWDPSVDPATYNWTATSTALAESAGKMDESKNPETVKQRARQERVLKRRRRETLLSSSQVELAKQLGSQPVLPLRPLGSSQPVHEDETPLSQAERGKHGGRLHLRKSSGPATKKQKRPAGF